MNDTQPQPVPAGYEIRFQSLFQSGRAVVFPCDAEGHVALDALSEQARLNYMRARPGGPRLCRAGRVPQLSALNPANAQTLLAHCGGMHIRHNLQQLWRAFAHRTKSQCAPRVTSIR